jgi:hypothetical protein
LFTALTSDRSQRYGFPKEKLVNHSLRSVDGEAPTSSGGEKALRYDYDHDPRWGMTRRGQVATAVEIATEVTPNSM